MVSSQTEVTEGLWNLARAVVREGGRAEGGAASAGGQPGASGGTDSCSGCAQLRPFVVTAGTALSEEEL